MDPTYAGYLMNSQLVRQQLNKFGTGATVMHVYGADIEKIKVIRTLIKLKNIPTTAITINGIAE